MMRSIASRDGVAWSVRVSVCLSVCLSVLVTFVSAAKMTEIWGQTRIGSVVDQAALDGVHMVPPANTIQ